MLGDKIYKPLVEYNSKGEKTEDKRPAYAELALWCSTNNARLQEFEEYYEAVAIPEPSQQEVIRREAQQLKDFLSSTDYAVVKCYDRGLVFRDEYPELYEQRQQARDRINELEN